MNKEDYILLLIEKLANCLIDDKMTKEEKAKELMFVWERARSLRNKV